MTAQTAANAGPQRRDRWRQRAVLAACAFALWLPFADKPFHVDDPMFLWTAQQIRVSPVDFFGFDVNWTGTSEPMWRTNQNPPGTSYALAGVALVLGWSELALHLGMLVPFAALVLGVYELARALRAPPLLASLLLVAMPGVLASASSIMADVLATALWCWSVVLWLQGIERRSLPRLLGAGLLAGACIATKYVGLGLLPLFLVHGLVATRRPGAWVATPVVAALLTIGLRQLMVVQYGHDPLLAAGAYATDDASRADGPLLRSFLGLSFLGGACALVLLLGPWLWSRRQIAGWAAVATGLALALGFGPSFLRTPLPVSPGLRWWLIAHIALFVVAGLQLVWLTARGMLRERSADRLLVGCWIAGILLFASLVNWTTNVRALLPATPALAIVLAWELRARWPAAWWRIGAWPVAAGVLLSLLVAQGDYASARATRAAAEDLAATAESWRGSSRFLGSWGFQEYMSAHGVRKLDFRHDRLDSGALIIVPKFGSNNVRPPAAATRLLDVRHYPVTALAATHDPSRGASFYCSDFGPLPYALAPPGPDTYLLFELIRPLRLRYRADE